MSSERFDKPLATRDGSERQGLWLAIGAGALIGVAGLTYYQQQTRNKVGYRPPDSAPARTARNVSGDHALTGRTVTINKPRRELYAFWRDFTNLASFMENVRAVTAQDDLTRWTIAGPAGRDVTIESRIVEDREGEIIAWRSTNASDIDSEGHVAFRDAPGGRGTEVEAVISYVPPAGEIGRWIAKLFQAEPAIQGRRELKRFKMLMETGEIATNSNQKTV